MVAKSRDKAAVTMTTLPSSSSSRVCRLNSHDKETVAELKKANNALRTHTHTHMQDKTQKETKLNKLQTQCLFGIIFTDLRKIHII